MKLLRLNLLAFGPFTDRVLDFEGAGGQLHLIVGANEAGKSSALRAMTDLRFGIHGQTADDFVHDYKSMRIAGLFAGRDGARIALARRKGNKGTLARIDADTLEPLADAAVPPELEQALTGQLSREEFGLLFGIDHARLRDGGRLLLSGEAEVGAALFEASAGSVGGIRKLLDALDGEAKKHFNPHGRSEAATLNSAVKAWTAARATAKDATIKPAEWERLRKAADAAETARRACADALTALRRDEAAARELKVLIPQLAEHDQLARRAAELADAPDLPADAAAKRGIAEAELAAAETAARSAANELADAETALATLTPDPAALAQAAGIEKLAKDAGEARAHRVELGRLEPRARDAAERLTLAAARIAAGRATADVVAALPSEPDCRALRERAAEAEKLAARLRDDGAKAAQLRAELDAAAPAAPLDPAWVEALQDALDVVLAHEARAAQLRKQRQQHDDTSAELRALLADLGAADAAALDIVTPLARDELHALRDEFAARSAGLKRRDDALAVLDADLATLRVEEAGLLARGRPATETSRDAARAARELAWNWLRRVAVERVATAQDAARDLELPLARDAAALADHVARLVADADRQADALHADASRAANLAACQLRIGQVDSARAAQLVERAIAAQEHAARNARWQARRAECHLPALDDFDALADWQSRREQARALAADIARSGAEIAAIDSAASAALRRLAAALAAPDAARKSDAAPIADLFAAPSADITIDITTDAAALIARARTRLDHAAARKSDYERQTAALAERRRLLDELGARAATDRARLDEHLRALAHWHARLLLPADAQPGDIAPRLAELGEVVALDRKCRDAELARNERGAELRQLARDAERLAALLGDAGTAGAASVAGTASASAAAPANINANAVEAAADPIACADALLVRLATARATAQRADALARDRQRASTALDRARADADHARASLAAFCAAAGCTDASALPDLEARAADRRAARDGLARARAELDRTAPGATPDDIRARTAGLDLPGLDARLAELAAAIATADADATRAIQTATEAARALNAIDTSDAAARAREAMEHEAARARAALRPWLRLRLAHGLLGSAMEQFRERAQAPMVAAAGNYFAAMTAGRYPKLVVDDIDGRLVLAAETVSAKRVPPEGLSEGTADQLYLALRLAALDLRGERDAAMPLVLDDVLMTSDDDRARNILGALARFARRRQVLVFTHHSHLARIARAVNDADGLGTISVLNLE